MTSQEYEYRGLMAATWDLLRGDTSTWPDRFFYRKVIDRYGQPVLDVGCGTGRLLIDYYQAGIDIDGVDNSAEMLAISRRKAQAANLNPNIYDQNVEVLGLPRTYRTILVPSSSFQLIVDRDDAAQAMTQFYNHLEPGGALIMTFFITWEPGDPLAADDWYLLQEVVRPEDGATVRRWVKNRVDPDLQVQYTRDRYEILLNDEIIASEAHRRSPALRWYSQQQAAQLYRDVGFTNIQILAFNSFEPAKSADDEFMILAERPKYIETDAGKRYICNADPLPVFTLGSTNDLSEDSHAKTQGRKEDRIFFAACVSHFLFC